VRRTFTTKQPSGLHRKALLVLGLTRKGGEGFRTVPAFGGLLWAAVAPLELNDEAEGLRIE
jgi:hypothetical protein